MRASGVTLFPLMVLGMLAGLTYWLQKAVEVSPAQRAQQRHDPDFMVEHFTVQRFDSQGLPVQFLRADKMVHFPDDDSSELDNPRLTYFRPTGQVRVSARHAWLNKDGKEVRLNGSVVVVREAATPTTIRTEALTAFPDDDFVRGSVPVTIIQGLRTLSANAFEYHGDQKIGILSGHVRGIFQRKSQE
ncbi:MAG: LPS export ABC transporter periplasmic protein LptC [Proteobacteria bacterium]|nr:LPS export ABC transporter periplasmic protein LptC [Pseudomonadota bacterium]HQR03750.1 LPS export ABC transporter periplasmic protein LptC [Rhodocyclaceae bacterium]